MIAQRLFVLASVASLAAGCTCASPAVPRNVLVITLDTTRADHIGAYGDKSGATPTLDRLAAEGVRFEHAFTVTPLTIPAHSSLFTGLYPPRHGVRDNGDYMLGDGATTLAERLHARGYGTMASVGAEVTSHHWGFSQGFDAYFDDMGPTDDGNRWHVERTGDKVVDDALGWLTEHKDDSKPWFSWVHLFDAHYPYEPPEPFASRFPKAKYEGEIAFADSQVGRLIQFLEESGQLNDTWVFVMGDHGEGLGEHGEGMHGVLLYTATTHVPLIVRPPAGHALSRVVDFPVSLVDVVPTILGAQGMEVPAGLDGLDLSAWLGKATPSERPARDLYAESFYAYNHYSWAPQKVLIDTTRYLLRSTTPELFALSDLAQTHDLVEAEDQRFQEMDGRLAALYASFAATDGTANGTSSKAELSGDQLAQLEALGYVTSGGGAGEPADNLPDPVKSLPILRKVEGARQALREERFDEAKALLAEIIVEDPGLMEPRMMQATVLARSGDLPGAIAVVEEVVRMRPGASQPMAMLGTLKLQSGDTNGAIEMMRQALDVDPNAAQSWVAYLHALFMSSQYERLEVEVERAGRSLGDVAVVVGMRGVLQVFKGNFAEGGKLLEAAIQLEPNQPFMHFGLGVSQREAGDVVHAEESFLEEIRIQPPSLPARKMLVELYAGQQRYEDQLAQLDAIIQFEPNDPLNQQARAQALFNLKRYSEASEAVNACLALDANDSGCVMLQANVLNKLGHPVEAKAAYERALDLRKLEQADAMAKRNPLLPRLTPQ